MKKMKFSVVNYEVIVEHPDGMLLGGFSGSYSTGKDEDPPGGANNCEGGNCVKGCGNGQNVGGCNTVAGCGT